MYFNLISNLRNGAGLERDCQILAERLAEQGHTSRGIQFNLSPPRGSVADVNVFVETLVPGMFPLARRQWVYVNPEWFSSCWKKYLHGCERVIVKTQHAYDLLKPMTKLDQLVYTGFEARDLYDPLVPRERTFLHAAGRSQTKNTVETLEAWRNGNGFPRLSLVADMQYRCPPGISWFKRVVDQEMIRLMNSSIFAIMPSSYEGFGHSLHESLGCGAVILTTNAEPMRTIGEHCPEGLIEDAGTSPRTNYLQNTYAVRPKAISDAVRRILDLPAEKIAAYSARSREKFLAGRTEFRQRFAELVNG
jgi:Glycosyl transferases group 1